jgi:hypothetical protein
MAEKDIQYEAGITKGISQLWNVGNNIGQAKLTLSNFIIEKQNERSALPANSKEYSDLSVQILGIRALKEFVSTKKEVPGGVPGEVIDKNKDFFDYF